MAYYINSSHGLIRETKIENGVFQEYIDHIDKVRFFIGSTYPTCTASKPINNLKDAHELVNKLILKK